MEDRDDLLDCFCGCPCLPMKTVSITKRIARLRKNLKRMGGVIIAFSGGVDSTFLSAVAREELREQAVAVTAFSPIFSRHEQKDSLNIARHLGLRLEYIKSSKFNITRFSDNHKNRCYLCKRELFCHLKDIARHHNIRFIADGTNMDDLYDDRPGLRAAREFKIVSPLVDAGFTKADIRLASRMMRLPTADKPSMACLATRFPYGVPITKSGMAAVDNAEEKIRQMGFRQVRVRHRGMTARIEVENDQVRRLCSKEVWRRIFEVAKSSGYSYITVDINGYRELRLNSAKRKKLNKTAIKRQSMKVNIQRIFIL